MTETILVYCKFQVEGVHHWPEATNYLKHPHRHLFHFTVKMEVKHDNREVEFIAWKRELQKHLAPPWGTVTLSCEQIATNLLSYLFGRYGRDRCYIVDVSEDGENGALVVYEPEGE